MYGLMYEYEVDHAFVVTTSDFTKECYRFVEGKEMTLISGDALLLRIVKL
jgi:restriction endonuclease Mrr